MIHIILIRHGHTAWNVGEERGQRFRGTIDLPLADEGLAQATATARRLAAAPLAAIYASPLQRATRTAQAIAEPHGLPVQLLPGLTSMNYGDWAGQLHTDVARYWPELYRRWRHDPFSIQIPGGDSALDLRRRVVSAVRHILTCHADGQTIALISHQVVTKTLICALVGLDTTTYQRFGQDLCNLSRIDYDPVTAQYVLAGLNDTCHLTSALPSAEGAGARIVLVRHGQTAWNAGAGEERFRGRTDLCLDDEGLAQAQALARRLQNEPIAALYASPLFRTQQTITPLADKLDQAIQPHTGLLDIDYGCFQGLTHADAAAAFAEQYALWRAFPSRVRFPDGESLGDVQARLLALVDELAERHRRQTTVLAGHQIVNKVLACTLLGLDLDQVGRIRQDTVAVNVFQQVNGIWHILGLNDTCHWT
jgi:broad specificity phosphatase PhoE